MQEFLRYEDVPIDELTLYPGNARRNDVNGIVQSIRKNGQYRTVVVREVENGPLIILAGNHTTQALRKMGSATVRCEILRCDDNEARAINLADNRYNDLAFYDEDAMAQILSELDGNFDGTGWDAKSAEKYLKEAEPEPPLPDQEPTWGIIVNCRDEEQQSELLMKLSDDGLDVRALMG
jgi:hypothetical protein